MKPFAKPILLTGTLLLAPIYAGCSTVPTALGCSALAEPILTRDTEHPAIGESGDAATDWMLLGTAYAGALNRANDDKQTGFAIIRACEIRDSSARPRSRWRFW